jgi:hypothetical protein
MTPDHIGLIIAVILTVVALGGIAVTIAERNRKV